MVSASAGSRIRFAPEGVFARRLAERSRSLSAATGRSIHASASVWLCAGVFAASGLLTYGLLLGGVGGVWGAGLWIVLAAFVAFTLIVQLGHDATHSALSPHAWVNRMMEFLIFGIIGVDGQLWRDRHLRLHHRVVNLPGTGIDADAVAALRLMPSKPWHWWHSLQPVYAPLLYLIGHFSTVWLEDMAALRVVRPLASRKYGWLAIFTGGKILHVALFLLIPWLVLKPSPGALLLSYGLASGIIALCFAVLVIGTHVSDIAAFPEPDGAGHLPHDWATHQMLTSVDWAPTSAVAVLISGGSNAHVAHHLFPMHCHAHAAGLSKIIAETAAECGIPHHVTTFRGLVMGHWRQIVALSRRPVSKAA